MGDTKSNTHRDGLLARSSEWMGDRLEQAQGDMALEDWRLNEQGHHKDADQDG
jgi:hypothetical protein